MTFIKNAIKNNKMLTVNVLFALSLFIYNLTSSNSMAYFWFAMILFGIYAIFSTELYKQTYDAYNKVNDDLIKELNNHQDTLESYKKTLELLNISINNADTLTKRNQDLNKQLKTLKEQYAQDEISKMIYNQCMEMEDLDE